LIIAYVLLSYFMSPYHPIRQTIERVIGPLLAPIRQILPQTGMLDLSPLVLFILVQIISALLVNFLRG
jgi:YggT family protein